MNKEEFIRELTKLNISIKQETLEKLDIYYKLLVKENEKYNLTSITNEKDVYLKHFYDSITIVNTVDINNKSICDIGTGAGFPGIVLKIFYPNIALTLIEATKKRCEFLALITKELNLENVTVINKRVEEYAKDNREKFDIVTCRAVAKLKILLELAIPLVKINGYFIPLKGIINNELENIDNYYKKLNINLLEIKEFTLPIEESKRTILKFQKLEKTDLRYPRRYSEIIKKEL